MRSAGALVVLVLLGACDAQGAPDAGASDVMDASASDAGADAAIDASATDAGAFDASAFDAAAFDASGADAGTPCAVGGVPGTCEHVDDCTGERMATPGFCPGPAEIQCCTRRDASMCDPSAMPLPNEGLTEAAGIGGCPPGMTRVDTFCVDRFEAALELVGGPSWSPFHNPGARAVRAVSIEGAIPQGYVSGTQAAAACAAAGKRLCTDAEWLRACRGPGLARTYPYPGARDDGRCNDARAVHPAVERFGTSESWIWSRLGDACINQLPDSVAPTGAHAGCVTDEGVLDLMGNLHEWTADPSGTFRGGYYVDTYRNGEGCLYRTTAHTMGHWDYSTGFRCCAD
ncbi:MAG: SUMF1/EgtB/PvdO family nonheme iron enzyme [Sandaracinaceae bacterium]|nr:SUMF1/EgtB/PvdO family nonheme iron enzyme [Sandaracinaceae bacterium]